MCIRATNRLRRTHLQVLPVCMRWQSGLCAGALKTAKHLGGHGNGRGKRCEQCFCGFLTMGSSYLWNVCMTVCGWGTGGQHCDSQLHLKQTESPKEGFLLRLFSSCSASSCPPHLLLPLHTQTYADAEVADSVKPGLHASTSLHLQLESLWSKVISLLKGKKRSLKNRAYVSVQYCALPS